MGELKAIFEAQRAATRRVCVMLQHEAWENHNKALLQLLWNIGYSPRHTAIVYQELAASEYRAIREAMGVE